jgi:hypothetical protein
MGILLIIREDKYHVSTAIEELLGMSMTDLQLFWPQIIMAKDSTLLTMSLLTKMITQSGLLTQVMES